MLNKFDFEAKNTKTALDYYYANQYELSAKSSSWQNCALNLKRAAEYIFNISLKGAENEHNKFLHNSESGEFEKNQSRTIEGEELEWCLDAELNRVYYMLIGLALENLFKGILIKTNPEFLKNKKGLNHNLIDYAQKCQFSLNEDQRFVLEELQKDIEWRGKYPIPKSANKLKSKFTVGGATNIKDAYFPGRDFINEMFDNLLERYKNFGDT